MNSLKLLSRVSDLHFRSFLRPLKCNHFETNNIKVSYLTILIFDPETVKKNIEILSLITGNERMYP